MWCGCRTRASAKRNDLFDAHLPLMRYEQQPGLRPLGAQVRAQAARRHRLRRTAEALHLAVRSLIARAEVAYLLARLARHDKRAAGLAG